MKNIIIITSNAIRHNYFKMIFSQDKNINILKTYVESETTFKLQYKNNKTDILDDKLSLHFNARHNTEYDFFSDSIEYLDDNSNSKFIKKNEINETHIIDEIITINPDLIITYGCSIVKPKLISSFKNKIINVHLGLSPYYFGSGTNFHCLVNDELQFEGYTFMYMNEGIDTGEIIHQARAKILPFDNPHQIGNRLIKHMTKNFIKLIKNFELIEKKEEVTKYKGKTYKIKDATNILTLQLYKNFEMDSVIRYLKTQDKLLKKFPLIEQKFLKEST